MEGNSIWGVVTCPYEMPEERSVSIDNELDMKLVEMMVLDGCHGKV